MNAAQVLPVVLAAALLAGGAAPAMAAGERAEAARRALEQERARILEEQARRAAEKLRRRAERSLSDLVGLGDRSVASECRDIGQAREARASPPPRAAPEIMYPVNPVLRFEGRPGEEAGLVARCLYMPLAGIAS